MSALYGKQQIGTRQQTTQLRHNRAVAIGYLRNHYIELINTGRDQAGEVDDRIDPADPHSQVLEIGKWERRRHKRSGRDGRLRRAESRAEDDDGLTGLRRRAWDSLLN